MTGQCTQQDILHLAPQSIRLWEPAEKATYSDKPLDAIDILKPFHKEPHHRVRRPVYLALQECNMVIVHESQDPLVVVGTHPHLDAQVPIVGCLKRRRPVVENTDQPAVRRTNVPQPGEEARVRRVERVAEDGAVAALLVVPASPREQALVVGLPRDLGLQPGERLGLPLSVEERHVHVKQAHQAVGEVLGAGGLSRRRPRQLLRHGQEAQGLAGHPARAEVVPRRGEEAGGDGGDPLEGRGEARGRLVADDLPAPVVELHAGRRD